MTTTAAPGVARTSIEWANRNAASAPEMGVPIPGPRSQELFAKTQRYQYGSYFGIVNLMPVGFVEGDGVTLTDADGNRYLDFTHGHMVAALGHGHPAVTEAIARQAGRLMNVRDFPTDLRVELMERLAAITPGDLNVFQFFNTGTEMTEAAMRVARAATGRHEFLSFYGEYHGRTTGSIATSSGNPATGPRPGGFFTVPSGFCYRCEFGKTYPDCNLFCTDFAERAMKANSHGALAGIIAEPITNGSGARVYPPGYLRRLREIADRNGMLLILDEHATSLGRTGAWFACEHEGVVPDALLFGKYLGNGYPITVLAIRESLKDALQATQPSTTYGGQPAACAAALAVLDTIENEGLVQWAAELGEKCLARMKQIEDAHPSVGQARGKGLMLAFDFVESKESRTASPKAGQLMYQNCMRRGVIVSGGGNAVRISPMLVTSEETALRGLDLIEDAITEMECELGYV